MCGIAGFYNLTKQGISFPEARLLTMNELQKHRGPDGSGIWIEDTGRAGLAHVRLSIIGLNNGRQPMHAPSGNCISFNGEIYNYPELKRELADQYSFRTDSDTEIILAAYEKWGRDCVCHLRGMFAFALWDARNQTLFCARDRFGIKPFYYMVEDGIFYFASEIKALLPFKREISVNEDVLNTYLTFQFSLDDNTMFSGISKLMPGHTMLCHREEIQNPEKYWEVVYEPDLEHSEKDFIEHTQELLTDAVRIHMRSDVPVGGYLSGGMDSSIIGTLAARCTDTPFQAFTGKFTCFPGYDESGYARILANEKKMELFEIDITSDHFRDSIQKVIYHLDEPVAGPGAFPQYWVSQLVSEHRKVVLGGQGGDELFGGYVRYLVAYFEQCIKGAIEGTLNNGNFVVSYESIIPNLQSLRQYKPMIRSFWKEGVFDDLESRYFRLVNRAPDMRREICWENIRSQQNVQDLFHSIFSAENVRPTAYFDLMTHFDFKTLLPALLQVEDRMSMAHGVESRVPFLDHPLIEFLATVPANVKFKNGQLKRLLGLAFGDQLPDAILHRKDKMGFPVPFSEWLAGDLHKMVQEIFLTQKNRNRPYFNTDLILQEIAGENKFGRKMWGLLSLELWFQNFIDRSGDFQHVFRKNISLTHSKSGELLC